jgi:chaperone modulatory protein CbpM
MIERRDFLVRARLDEASLHVFVEAGWIARAEAFTEADLARACLVRDLREAMGVNDEGVSVALDLLDQLHATRAALKRAVAALRATGGEEEP